MQQECKTCQISFQISEEEIRALDKLSPTIGGKKYKIPTPVRCPDCRLRDRNIHRNEQYMYKSKTSSKGEPVISMYSPENEWNKDLKIWTHDEWWSDEWDGCDYAQEFDFGPKVKPFFEQFQELHMKIPKIGLLGVGNENSPFTTMTGYCKNCHLINCSENCEDCYYGKLIQDSTDVMDSAYAYDSELLYECFYAKDCYNCAYISYSQSCQDCFFSENLKGCKNCFLCTNLANKEYHFMNKPLEKEEYEAKVKEFMGTKEGVEKAKQILNEIRGQRVYKASNIMNCENCTGDFLTNCKNCFDCYDLSDSQDCRYIIVGVDVKDSMDCNNIYIKNELCYEVLSAISIYETLFSLFVFHSQNVLYSQHCYNSKNLFGCSGLRKKEYCILNKQYTQEEYEKIVPQIIEHMQKTGEWGEHFPAKYSFFGYNETCAQQYLPLTKDEALAKGYRWHEEEKKEFQPQTYQVPSNIHEASDSITAEILACEACRKNYKIMPQELTRLKKMNMPIPSKCPECRHITRMKLRNPRKLYDRTCMKCSAAVKSPYDPSHGAKTEKTVYCEKCYLEEVY